MRSTHACTPSFALSILNIHVGCCLFSHITKITKHNNYLSHIICLGNFVVCFVIINIPKTNLIKERSEKKMRSTHACTPFFATSLLNIHVGCCLFSHNSTIKTTKNKQVVFEVRHCLKSTPRPFINKQQ